MEEEEVAVTVEVEEEVSLITILMEVKIKSNPFFLFAPLILPSPFTQFDHSFE